MGQKMVGNNKIDDLAPDDDEMKKPRKSQMRKTVDYRSVLPCFLSLMYQLNTIFLQS